MPTPPHEPPLPLEKPVTALYLVAAVLYLWVVIVLMRFGKPDADPLLSCIAGVFAGLAVLCLGAAGGLL